MAAPIKDIVSMFDTEKHRALSDRPFEHGLQRFADAGQSGTTSIVSEDCNHFVDQMMHELLGKK